MKSINPGKRYFPSWHFAMLNDRQRNDIIEAGIREANVAGKTVFEIGTGAGLTALLFAKHGAKKVITCEMDIQLAEIARESVKKHHYDHVVHVIEKKSTEIINDGTLTFQPDFIFTETIDCGVVNEGFYSVSQDIQRIKHCNTQVLPDAIVQYGQLIESQDIYELNNVQVINSLDLSGLNFYSTKSYFPVRASLYRPRLLSHIQKINEYRYCDNNKPQPKELRITTQINGLCHGLLTYFNACFGNYVISNNATSSHWHQAFHPLENPVYLESGQLYKFEFSPTGILTIKDQNNA